MNAINPTDRTYQALNTAYDHFNAVLFESRLPRCLITMRNKGKRNLGYFAGQRFGTRDGQEITDEIALNASHFSTRTTEEILSTLVHEMTHLEQSHFGEPSRGGYHNKAWGDLMRRVGLIPSNTGEPGGKDTGQQMTHYVEQGGRFERACAELVSSGCTLHYVEMWTDEGTRKRKAASKTKYTCETCGTNAWAKPNTALVCGACYEETGEVLVMKAEQADEDEGDGED